MIGICNVDVQNISAMAVSYGSLPNRSTDMSPLPEHVARNQENEKQHENIKFKATGGSEGQKIFLIFYSIWPNLKVAFYRMLK